MKCNSAKKIYNKLILPNNIDDLEPAQITQYIGILGLIFNNIRKSISNFKNSNIFELYFKTFLPFSGKIKK